MRRLWSFTNFLGLLLLLGGVLGLFVTQSSLDTKQLNLPSDLEPGGPRKLKLHFGKDSQDGMMVEERMVQLEQGEDLPTRVLVELLKGPQIPGGVPLVPAGTPVPTVFVRDATALVDFPAAYSRLGYGITAESALIYGIASSLLEFKQNPKIDQVKFLLEGKEVESLGHLSLIDPFKRP